jgi:hypothetical protein
VGQECRLYTLCKKIRLLSPKREAGVTVQVISNVIVFMCFFSYIPLITVTYARCLCAQFEEEKITLVTSTRVLRLQKEGEDLFSVCCPRSPVGPRKEVGMLGDGLFFYLQISGLKFPFRCLQFFSTHVFCCHKEAYLLKLYFNSLSICVLGLP